MLDRSSELAVREFGTDRVTVLCYLLMHGVSATCPTPEVDAWASLDVSTETDHNSIYLFECSSTSLEDFAQNCISILTWASAQQSVIASALQFDAAFASSGDDELFAEDTLDQVYGVSGCGMGPLLALDRNVLESEEWATLLRRFRLRYRQAVGLH